MSLRFPIKDVNIKTNTVKRQIENPTFFNNEVRLNQREFILDLEYVGWFYAGNGNSIEIVRYPATNINKLELYLNGSVYGAILHQRKNLPMHGSSFFFRESGIMICGESGAGKSSLTTAFCLDGAAFLTDDVTPILLKDGLPHIWVMSDRIKLHRDSLTQLNQSQDNLVQIGPEWEKFYFPIQSGKGEVVPLNQIIVLHIHDEPAIHIEPLDGVQKFIALRNEIYRWEYLRGMPESEAAYLNQLATMSQTVRVTKVTRPANIPIRQLQAQLERLILEAKGGQKLVPVPYIS